MSAKRDDKILVPREAFLELLNAFKGPMYLTNELWAIQSLPGTPVYVLREAVNEEFKK